MSSTKDRQRAAARARLEREMTARAEAAARRRQRRKVISLSAALVVLVGVAVLVVVEVAGGGGNAVTPLAASPSATEGPCVWKPNPDPSASASTQPNPYLKDVGMPPATGEPRSGYRDMTIDTNRGQIVIELDLAHAPCTSESFTYLASKHFFDGSSCSRVVEDSSVNQQSGLPSESHIVQCGDPSGTGKGGPGYTFADENLPTGQRPAYPAGVVAMANSGPDTNGSQFFMVYGDSTYPANYTIFGRIIKGLDIVAEVGTGGDDGSNPAGGGKPTKTLTFEKVTVGPVKQTSASPAPLPSPTPAGSASPAGSAAP